MLTRPINAESASLPTIAYAQAVELSGHQRLLFISGQTPTDAAGAVPQGFDAQCRLAWRNVEAQLAAAGMTLDNLVMHRTYLADRAHALDNRAVRQDVLGGRTPACTVVIAGIFDADWLVEIEAIAAA